MASSYKHIKEEFVSNLSGGTIAEINLVTLAAPAAVFVWSALQAQYGFFEEASAAAFVADFILNVGAILLATTLYSSAPATLLGILFVSTVMYRFSPSTPAPRRPAKSPAGGKTDAKKQNLSPFPVKPFLTAYRGSMMVVTCSSILAVDFPVFPRRFAKVETWGTSLMDLGVGSFVFSAGLVAAKGVLKERMLLNVEGGKNSRSVISRAITAIRQALPLLVLGFARLASVKNLDYAEHVSEYGIHWNFFFTMAIVPLALAFLQPLITLIPGPAFGIGGLFVSAAFEFVLHSTDLQSWALTAPRIGLVAQNKEGIVSSVGYVSVFLLGMSTGTVVLPRLPQQGSLMSKLLDTVGIKGGPKASQIQTADITRVRLIASLLISSLIYTGLLAAQSFKKDLPLLHNPISRRLANFPYVLWVAAFNTAQIALYCLVESYFFPSVRHATTAEAEQEEATKATSRVLADFNAGGLIIFLLANLGTGLVNMSLNTIKAPPPVAMGVLIIYMGLLTIAARSLKGIKLKI